MSSPPAADLEGSVRALVRTLSATGLTAIAIYVALSLGVAFAGSLAAVFLVPVLAPGHALLFGHEMPDAASGIETQALTLATATAVFALLRWQTARLGARLSARYAMNLRHSVHARLIGAPLDALADSTSAEIANVLTYNVEILTQGFSALLQLLAAGLTAAVSFGFACWISPSLLLGIPVVLGIGLLVSAIHGREQSRISRQYVADLTRLFWLSENFPRRLRHVRSFGRADAEKENFGAISGRLSRGFRRQQELIASGRLMTELLAALAITVVFVLAHGLRVADRSSLIAVCLLLGRLLPYFGSTRQNFQQMRYAAPAFELWRRYMSLDSAPVPAASALSPYRGEALRIERIRLQTPTGLEIGGLVLVPGALTFISGDSGIGKSSLVDVLAGMATPAAFVAWHGERSLSFADYRELVGRGAYVSQNARPWHSCVRECLLWAAPDATEEMLRGALADVGLERRLAATADGLETALHSSSSRLSGGELQRLMLAQVILREPCLAVLDEATNALDAAAELTALAALKRRLPQTILIVVSHSSGIAAIADQCLTVGNHHNDIDSADGRVPVRRMGGQY